MQQISAMPSETPQPGFESLAPGEARSERELLSSARRGDRQAQAELYEKHIYGSVAIRGLLRRAVSSETEREDLLHEIFLAAVEGKGEFRGDARLSTYLFRVAQLTVFDAHRAANTQKRGGHIRLVGDAEWAENAALEPSSRSFQYEEIETRLALDWLMQQVPEAYRVALRLRIVEELDYQQIADQLAIPLNTVSTRIFKGKAVLVKLLRQSGFKMNDANARPE
jgi:RNA polymerase sigma-70 factor (ECF subfamily)